MRPPADALFIRRPCYLKLGDSTVLSSIRLRADCFFRHWPLKDAHLDEEGYIHAVAYTSHADPQRPSEVLLRIDPVTSFLVEYRYMDHEILRVFALVAGEYREQPAT